jgi:carbon starvation protein
MNTIILIVVSFVGYIMAYRLYGRYIARKILVISDKNLMPAHELKDGIDYVPTRKSIVFGHHFTTIAGIGPIVGPAIGVIWGWVPAFLWVFIGSIFMGAVHDFATLVISARNQGKSIGDLTGNIVNNSTRYAFQFLIQFLLWMVLSLFTIIVSTLFVRHPEAVLPVWLQIPIAVWLGWQIKNGRNELVYSIIAVFLMYITIILGTYFPVEIPLKDYKELAWSLIIFVYVFLASTVPVQKLLQPRDYINSHQLLIAMVLLILAILIAHPLITAPAVNPALHKPGSDIPALMPLLFITIACGAISGFHSLASSGTTVKQVNKENDSLFIGYGGMILEGFLAILVIIAVVGGLGLGLEKGNITYTGINAFNTQYSTWKGIAAGIDISPKIEAFVVGASNLLSRLGIPSQIGTTLIAVFIVSFANTTLDSATRIQRLSFQEIFKTKKGAAIRPFDNRYIATFIVVILAALITFYQLRIEGALALWRMFGALNQLLAALGLGIVSIYLYHKGKNYLVSFIPMLFVLTITVWAMVKNVVSYYESGNTLLLIIAVLILILTGWMLISGTGSLLIKRYK